MEMIHHLKYRGKIQLAKPLGNFLFTAFLHFWDTNPFDFIVPVPLHVKRFRIRGFNQAYLLIKDWHELSRFTCREIPDPKISRDILVRSRWTEPQTGLDRKERMSNIKNAFTITDKRVVKGKRILLVDDVYTTGATVNECAKTFLKSGAQSVDVLTLARAA
jgi:ComF family protein